VKKELKNSSIWVEKGAPKNREFFDGFANSKGSEN